MMTREQIEQAIDENLDSIGSDSEGVLRMADGREATDADLQAAYVEHWRLKALLRVTP